MRLHQFDELKMKTLAYLKGQTEAKTKSKDVAEALKISVENAQMVLLRLHRQRLANREKLIMYKKRGAAPQSWCWVYSLNERGLKRLKYLRER